MKWHVLLGNLSTINCSSSIRKTSPIIVEQLPTLTYILKFSFLLVISFIIGKVVQLRRWSERWWRLSIRSTKPLFLVYYGCISTIVLHVYVNEQFSPTDLEDWCFGWLKIGLIMRLPIWHGDDLRWISHGADGALESMYEVAIGLLEKMHLMLLNQVALAIDGASRMMGHCMGLASRMYAEVSTLINVHCIAHRVA